MSVTKVMNLCHGCGNQVSYLAEKCENCGAGIDDANSDDPDERGWIRAELTEKGAERLIKAGQGLWTQDDFATKPAAASVRVSDVIG